MLYIRGHKIIKGYIGNTPISHVGFGKSGLIKIKSENGGSDYPNNLIAKYTANVSGVLPTFNDGYQYTVNETESNGIYTVELFSDDDFTSCSFNGKTQLLTVEYLKITDKATNMVNMFNNCNNLTSLDASKWNTSNVTDMSAMFNNCNNLISLDVSKWNTSNVTNIANIFADCHNLSVLDLTNWDTSNITDFTWLFTRCYNLTSIGNIGNWDTSNVGCFSSMFFECNKLSELDLSSWDTSNVTDMGWMFYRCTSLNKLNISNWNTSNVTYIDGIFNETPIVKIIMNNSGYNSVNKIIYQLPTRTTDSMGTLNIAGVDDISQVNITTAQSKYWNINTSIFILRTRTT